MGTEITKFCLEKTTENLLHEVAFSLLDGVWVCIVNLCSSILLFFLRPVWVRAFFDIATNY